LKSIQLTIDDKSNIKKSLCSYILDESIEDEYSKFISAFIVQCQGDKFLSNQLNDIKKGVVLYTGLKYNSDISKIGNWDTNLTIYIDTEILFHLAGYNSSLYKDLFDEFYKLVNEINTNSINKTGKEKIHLLYFGEVKDEIERFFNKAEYIVEGKETPDPSREAMRSIVNGCKSASDVVLKKSNFYNLLKNHGIKEENEKDFYNKDNYEYNIEGKELLEHLQNLYSTKKNDYDISRNIKFLNYINIFRKGESNTSFENIGTILLTGNSATIKIAWDDSIKKNGNVPLATTLGFITNKLWFRLGKGLGSTGNTYPKSFEIVTKAQIVLSTQINNSVSEKYDNLQEEYKKGKINKDIATTALLNLRSQVKTPENINGENLNDVLDCISETDIEKMKEEQEHQKIKKQNIENENISLKEEVQILSTRLNKIQIQKNNEKYHNALRKYVKHKITSSFLSALLKIIGYIFCFTIAIFVYYFNLIEDITNDHGLPKIYKLIIAICFVVLPIILSKCKLKNMRKIIHCIFSSKYRKYSHLKCIRIFIKQYNDQINKK
jgi:hypothetical protein